MKYIIKASLLILIALMITNCTKNSVSSSNENANTYNGQWLLTNRNIFDSILVFKKIEDADSTVVLGHKYSINGSEMKFSVLNPMPQCGNGTFYLDSCKFIQNNEEIVLDLKGGYLVQSTFVYKASYTPKDKSSNGFTLIRQKVIADKKSSLYEFSK